MSFSAVRVQSGRHRMQIRRVARLQSCRREDRLTSHHDILRPEARRLPMIHRGILSRYFHYRLVRCACEERIPLAVSRLAAAY